MFRCDDCKEVTGSHEPMTRRVTQRRQKAYSDGGVGWEIVKEIGVCQGCALKEKYDGDE